MYSTTTRGLCKECNGASYFIYPNFKEYYVVGTVCPLCNGSGLVEAQSSLMAKTYTVRLGMMYRFIGRCTETCKISFDDAMAHLAGSARLPIFGLTLVVKAAQLEAEDTVPNSVIMKTAHMTIEYSISAKDDFFKYYCLYFNLDRLTDNVKWQK